MGIEQIPKVQGTTKKEKPALAEKKGDESKAKAKLDSVAPDPPRQVVKEPSTARLHPQKPGPTSGRKPFEKQVEQLKTALRTQRTANADIAKQALALCMQYCLRRSRKTKQIGIALCDDVVECCDDNETIELAKQLKCVLTAEADLHEVSADSTLRALAALMDVVDFANSEDPE